MMVLLIKAGQALRTYSLLESGMPRAFTRRWRFRPLTCLLGIVALSMSLVAISAHRLLSGLDALGVRNRCRTVGVFAVALPLGRT
jgi:hypothetical protein